MFGVSWQAELFDELALRLTGIGQVEMVGSAADPAVITDGWSDLDVMITLTRPGQVDLLAGFDAWAVSDVRSTESQVLRIVLRDGRRLDMVVDGGVVAVPPLASDNDIRFVAAVAAAKMGRGDHLIGLHLTLELMRSCLVLAMRLRDGDAGTTVHRFGSERDALADDVSALLRRRVAVLPRPNIVERTVELYGRWRRQLDPCYEPDWSGLGSVLDRGLSRSSG